MNDLSGLWAERWGYRMTLNQAGDGSTRPCKSGRILAQNRFSRLLKLLY
jgi:hypothetical protein